MPGPVSSNNGSTIQRTSATRASDSAQAQGYGRAPSWENATRRNPIQRGHAGESVTHLQQELGRHGFPVNVDGKFGPETEAAVRRFQAANGCKVDGLVGPETRAALERGATTESASETARRRQSESVIGSERSSAPTEDQRSQPVDGGVRAGELQRTTSRGPQGEITPDGAGGGTVRGDLGQMQLPNGTTLTGPSGEVTVGTDGYVNAEGRLARAERDGTFIDVGRVSVESGRGTVRAEATAIEASTGDSNTFDFGSRIGDVGGEATFRVSAEEGRIGAGYRANIAEVNAAVGSVSAESTDDFRQSVRVSAGAPSGGAFVSWDDRDGDGARNYRLDVDIPIPGTPLGVGVSIETESPVKDGLALLASVNPITAPAAGVYRLGRALKFW